MKKVMQDFNCTGIKYHCAKSKVQLELEQDEQKRISRVFGTAVVICYAVIGAAVLAWAVVI